MPRSAKIASAQFVMSARSRIQGMATHSENANHARLMEMATANFVRTRTYDRCHVSGYAGSGISTWRMGGMTCNCSSAGEIGAGTTLTLGRADLTEFNLGFVWRLWRLSSEGLF